ncbi:MAG TPA: hypothetical protein ENK75_06320 [Saprospiraceae bacterium]|nr:hypothetical protein [Saprospiraceae bacterium]
MNKKNKHIDTFLTQKFGKDTGFTVPKNYFNTVEDTFFNHLLEEKLPETEGFSVPENYFNTLENKILNKINQRETKVITLKSKIISWLPVTAAASILLFIAINYFSTQNRLQFNTISSDDVASWLDNDYESIAPNDITFMMDTSDFNENIYANNTLKDTKIEEYINTTMDSYSLINEIN